MISFHEGCVTLDLAALVVVALALGAAFALDTGFLTVAAFLVDLGLVADPVDLADTGAGAGSGDAEVFEDIAVRVKRKELRSLRRGWWSRAKVEKSESGIRLSFLNNPVASPLCTSCDDREWWRCWISLC